ncbi:MAG: hypothetical protein HQL55_00770 [Magnetococcales bacterium]|nr:hypothetical protein [Magnetococcales bacterium]
MPSFWDQRDATYSAHQTVQQSNYRPLFFLLWQEKNGNQIQEFQGSHFHPLRTRWVYLAVR